MSVTTNLIKLAINWTPNAMIIWVANIILKGIAELTDFSLDLDSRKIYVQTTLNGETEQIEIWVDGFAVITEEQTKYFILEQGRSNKPWLNTIFSHIVGKPWKIPSLPQYQAYINLIAELLKAEAKEEENL
jgi:hypothetical protein